MPLPLATQREHAEMINRTLARQYPYAHPELDFRNPFELLVATVLSAQSTDVRVNRVTPTLFAAYPTARALAEAAPEHVENIIRSVGFFRTKTASLLALSQRVERDYGGKVPATLEELMSLPGVGRKTAIVVLGNAFGIPGISVDTHFGRLSRRFEWTTAKDPAVVETDVAQLFLPSEWTPLSHRVIFHGRRVCHSRKPACGACVVAELCPSFGIGETDEHKAQALLAYELAPGREALLEQLQANPSQAAHTRRRWQQELST